MGFDLDAALDMPLGYSQSNGTIPLRELLPRIYPGATVDHIEVTNGTSEANYLVALAVLEPGDEMAMEVPNYMQLWGVPAQPAGARSGTFRLQPGMRLGARLGRVRAGGQPEHAAALPVEPEQPVGCRPLRRRDAPHRRALRGDEHVAPGRRGLPRRRTRGRAHQELLGNERPRHRDERPVEGLRDPRRPHRVDRRAAARSSRRAGASTTTSPSARTSCRTWWRASRCGREPRARSTRAPAPSCSREPADHRASGRRASAACSSSTGREPAR